MKRHEKEPGIYRHFKGNEYEVLGVATIRKQKSHSLCTVLYTVIMGSGFDLLRCFAKKLTRILIQTRSRSIASREFVPDC